MQSAKPLTGKLVLDMTQGIAGPYCGRLLAEHGARVIKLEPPGGDWVRQIGGGPGETSVNYLYYNFGKENIEIDVKSSEGLAAAKAIAARADVVMESARPGATARRGLGYDVIRALNPRVLYLSVSGYGQEGPRASDPMTDTVAQAYSGMMSVNIGMDGVPHRIGTTIIDAITGLYGFQTVSMALMADNGPQHLDVSLMQASAAIMGPKVMEFDHFGKTPGSPNAPAGSYRTQDGWIAITVVREANFADLARALGQPGLAQDPRFIDFPARLANIGELTAVMEGILAERTTDEWIKIFNAENVLSSPINDYGMWLASPQAQASQGAPRMEVLDGVTAPVPRTPGREPYTETCVPTGADTARILSEFGIATAAE